MNVLQIESGLFPDEVTLREAVKKLDGEDCGLSHIDIRKLNIDDDKASELSEMVRKVELEKEYLRVIQHYYTALMADKTNDEYIKHWKQKKENDFKSYCWRG